MGEKRFLTSTDNYNPGRSLIKRGEIIVKPSSIKGLYIGRIIAPENGFFTSCTAVDLYHIPPGGRTISYREDEVLLHILSGEGYSIIDDVKYEWERGDTILIKPGYWHQHWNTSGKAVNMIAARATPLLNFIKPYPIREKGKDFTPVGDYIPNHPFGPGKQEPLTEVDKEWPGRPWGLWWEKQQQEWERQLKQGRTMMKGKDVRWEKEFGQGGEFNAMLADPSLGFDIRHLTMGIQAMVPGGCNDEHIHGEAVVYVLAGKGTVTISGEKYAVEAGDCGFVHVDEWHQFCSTSGPNDPAFTQMRILHRLGIEPYLFPFPYFEEAEDSTVPGFDPDYVPELPW